MIGISLSLPGVAALNKGGGASRFAPYPAPAGFYWDFVTQDGERVTEGGEPVVDLMSRAA